MKVIFKISHKWGPLNKIINLWTGSYGYSHCEIVFDQIKGYKGIAYSAEPGDKVSRFKKINFSDKSKWQVVELDVPYEKELEAFKIAKQTEGSRYDWFGIIFWFVVKLDAQHEGKWWCSEICAKMLGFKKFRVHPNKLAKLVGAPKIKKKF